VDLAIFVESHFLSAHDINLKWGSYWYSSFSDKGRSNGIFIWMRNEIVFNKANLVWNNKKGSALVFDFDIGGANIRFIVIYLNPSLKRKISSWSSILESIIPYFSTNTILVGDFNFVEYARDRSSGLVDSFTTHWRRIFLFENKLDLSDIFRSINNNTHTFSRAGSSARLDRAYACNMDKNYFSKLKVLSTPRGPNAPLSDHRPLMLQMSFNGGHSHKQASWRFNSDFLMDENVANFIRSQVSNRVSNSNNELFELWSSIRRWTSYYVNYNTYISDVELPAFSNMREKVKMKKEAYFHILKENPSPFSTINIYGRNNKKYINSLSLNSKTLVLQDEITQAFTEHYQNVFSTTLDDPLPSFDFKQIPQQNIEDSLIPITAEEMISFAKVLPNNKAPGPDGFPNELLKFMISHDHKFFLVLFNDWFLKLKPLPSFLKRSLISLIPKVEFPTTIREWRPISLLNNLYKLYTAIINKRLLRLISPYLHKSQLGFREGRWIHENLLLLHLVSFYTKYDSLDVDVENAFPSVSHSFLLRIIGQRVGAKWYYLIKNILGGEVKLIVNSLLSPSIKILKGVQQGDSIAPTLFIIAMDPLLRYLFKADSFNILGVKICSSSYNTLAAEILKLIFGFFCNIIFQ